MTSYKLLLTLASYLIPLFSYLIPLPVSAQSQVPALRNQVSLNGTWNFSATGDRRTTIPVPQAWDIGRQSNDPLALEATYSRQVTVPSSWSGQRIKLEFEGVNHIADVYVNNQFVGQHLGGWIPFAFDITNRVTPGTTFDLRVNVKGGRFDPITFLDGSTYKPLWPIGWYGNNRQWGILFDTWMRSYGPIHIEDTFIKTSFRQQAITIDYTLKNTHTSSKTVSLNIQVSRNNTNTLTFAQSNITLLAGEAKTVTLTQPWSDPLYWTPDTPNLYLLTTNLLENNQVIDTETRRFGFREVWMGDGDQWGLRNQLYLNNQRLNLRGDSMNAHSQGFLGVGLTYLPNRATWATTVDKLLSLNIRVIRPHQQPAPPFVLDVADEKGLVIIEESAILARQGIMPHNRKSEYFTNSRTWLREWVKARRNHPSILVWSAENEMGSTTGYINWFTNTEITTLGNDIRALDPTRIIIYEGDGSSGDSLVAINRHYPEGYEGTWSSGAMYSRFEANNSTRPYGYGEFLTDYGSNGPSNRWWQGTAVRGLRYMNFSDLRPYTLQWMWNSSPTTTDKQQRNIINSFASIPLFDKAYDGLGIDPLMNNSYPTIDEGAFLNRTLVLYHDEFTPGDITITTEIRVGSTLYAQGSATGSLATGNHTDIPASFQVPFQGGQLMTLTLTTRKNGQERFRESVLFNIREIGLSGTSQNTITLNWNSPTPTRTPTPFASPTPTGTGGPTPTPINYSLDNDTDIDIYDILILISRFTQNLIGDFNQNGRIDIFDFNTLLKNRL